jgi:DNA-binding NarL/FixJ family response regulator
MLHAMKTKVLIVEDHTVVRQGLRRILETAEDIEIIGEAENGKDAVQLARKCAPDVILLDLVLPGLSGSEVGRQIRRALPSGKIVVLSSYSDEETVREMVALGVSGYLPKQTAASELLRAIREVRRGNLFFGANIAKSIFGQAHNSARPGQFILKKPAKLTARETQVLKLVADGFPNKGVAAELGISIKTVEKHRQQVMNKLNIHEVAGLTRHAVSTRMIERHNASPQPTSLSQPQHS